MYKVGKNETNRKFFVASSLPCEIYSLLQKVKNLFERDFFIKTTSPEQKNDKKEEEIKEIGDYEDSIVAFGNII